MSDALDALAAQHGAGAPDALDALAAQHGASAPSVGHSPLMPAAALTADAVPLVGRAATAFAQAPNAAKLGGSIARAGTTLGALAHGFYTGNPSQIIAAPMEGWAAGKGGYFLTKAAQTVAAPVGRFLTKVAPITGVVGNALNVGTIAQAEADVNAKGQKYFDASDLDTLKTKVSDGASPTQVAAQLARGDASRFAQLLTAYSQSLGQGR